MGLEVLIGANPDSEKQEWVLDSYIIQVSLSRASISQTLCLPTDSTGPSKLDGAGHLLRRGAVLEIPALSHYG